MYSLADAARILQVPEARLRYWQRALRGRAPSGPRFDFGDLVALRSLKRLLEQGVPLRRIRRGIEALGPRGTLGALRAAPGVAQPLLAPWEGAWREPGGQFVLDFAATPRAAAPVAALPPRSALDWFERGCALDAEAEALPAGAGRSERLALAIRAYCNAVALSPDFADAHCNLGVAHFNRGARRAARAAYRRALQLDASHLEAHFNLANLLEAAGERAAALHHYRAALRADPFFAAAHLNAALLCEKLGLSQIALRHWRRYLQCKPQGAWAALARQRLARAAPRG